MLYMVGIDFTTAKVDERSIFSLTTEAKMGAYLELRRRFSKVGAVLLATCNRTELYFHTEEAQTDETLISLLYEICQVSPEAASGLFNTYGGKIAVSGRQIAPSIFTIRKEKEAVRHLFALASGLKSAILAEDQIITQVGDAIRFAREEGLSDAVLEILFRMAVTCAKQVKTRVVFSRGNSTAVDFILNSGYAFQHALVIGNGEMGRLCANRLVRKGIDTTVTIRTYHKGTSRIPAGCGGIAYSERYRMIPECDLIISATTSPHHTLVLEEFLQAKYRAGIVLADLAMPRDIDPEIMHLPGVTGLTLDDFQSDLLMEINQESFAKADGIISDFVGEFFHEMRNRNTLEEIRTIRTAFQEDLLARLEKRLRKQLENEELCKDLSNDILQASGRAADKLLFALRDGMDQNSFADVIRTLEQQYQTDLEQN